MTQILLAEDDRISRVMLQAVLQKWGYQVVSVSDGQQALDRLLDPSGPSLAILDWMMPALTGVEVCRILRGREGGRPLHLMLLTAKSKGNEAAEALAAGADDHLSKPYNLVELQARIELGLRRLRGRSLGGGDCDSCASGTSAEVGCSSRCAALNRIALGVVLEHPHLLDGVGVRKGVCDLDIVVQSVILHSRKLLSGRVEVEWSGQPAMVDVASENLSQALLNLFIFFRIHGGSDAPVVRLGIGSREDGGSVVVVLEADAPDLSSTEIDRILGDASGEGNLPSGFGPWFARSAVELSGGAFRMQARPEGGVLVEFRLPRAV